MITISLSGILACDTYEELVCPTCDGELVETIIVSLVACPSCDAIMLRTAGKVVEKKYRWA